MARRRYLIAYDIGDPRRLRRVCSIMEDFGVRLQYSVFLCDLSDMELVQWRSQIQTVINLRVDSIVQIDLGRIDIAATIVTIGAPRQLPPTDPIVL